MKRTTISPGDIADRGMNQTTATPVFALDEKRRWAAKQFDAPADSDEIPIGKMLEYLAAEDFVPSGTAREAIRTLTVNNDAASDDPLGEYIAAREMELSEDIETLAGDFFQLDVGERASRVEELLKDEGLSAPQRARLNELSEAAYVEIRPSDVSDPREAELAHLSLELFVLPPVVRSARIRQELARMQAGGAAWSAAARRLHRFRALSRLMPRFLREVKELDPARIENRRIEQSKMLGTAQSSTPNSWSLSPVPSNNTTGAGDSRGNYAWIFIVVAIFVIRGLVGLADRSSSSPPPPSYDPYDYNPPRSDNAFNENADPNRFPNFAPPPNASKSERERAERLNKLLKRIREQNNVDPIRGNNRNSSP